MKIYIDTNIYLDFYQASTDRLAALNDIEGLRRDILMPQQTAEEFRRNRAARLSALAKAIEGSNRLTVHTTAAIRDLPEFSAWTKSRDGAIECGRVVAGAVRDWLHQPDHDPVALAFERIVAGATCLSTAEAAVHRAQRRKLLGQPPASPDRHTIGDELIWETLVAAPKWDLTLVSRDRGFRDHQILLADEYRQANGGSLVITDSLREAFAAHGSASPAIDGVERDLNSLRETSLRIHDDCPKCGAPLGATGFEGGDGDSAWWLICPECHYEAFPSV